MIQHQGTKARRHKGNLLLVPLCLGAFVFFSLHVQAADKELGRFGAWEAHRVTAGADVYCFVAALPAKSEGKLAKRGEATLMVAHWPKRKAFNQVTVKSGFAIKKETPLELGVGGKIWKLAAEGDGAHGGSAKANGEIVSALRAGKTATAGAVPQNSAARIADTYSLENFAKALAAIDKECGAPKK